MHRPTILQIIPHLDAGGAELTVVEMAQAIVGIGGRALVLSQGGRLAAKLAEVGGELKPFPAATKNPLRIWANARALSRIIEQEKVNLIHARSRAPAWSALIAAKRSGVPFVTTYHGAYEERNALKRYYNSVMVRGDAIIANSNYTAELIAKRYGTPRERIEVIHRGVDVGTFDPERVTPERIATVRRRFGITGGERIVLQPARLTSWKGQSVVIDAAALLLAARQLDGVTVVLAGDAQGRTAYVEQLQGQIARLGLDGRVRLVGHVDDMAAAYAIAQVTVIASTKPEAFGRTAIEAAAMGCPVITTNIGAPPETVRTESQTCKTGITGWLVPPGRADALAAQLTEALSLTAEARLAIANRARRHVLDLYTKETMQARTLAVYERLLAAVS